MTKESLGVLILDNKESLYRISKSILLSDLDCAEALEEAIVRSFEKVHTLKNDAYAKTWLIRILLNECYKICRKNKRIGAIEVEPVYYSKDYSELYEAIYMLSEKQRLAIVLYYIDGYSIKEIASILKVTSDSVRMNLSRARKQLKRFLEDN